jgi:hypothetical protein
MMMNVRIPCEDFNDAVLDGTAGSTISRILEDIKPEAVWFTEIEGDRAAVLIVDVKDPSRIPALSEPWFLAFSAEVEFRVAMTPEELSKADIDKIGEDWS